MNGFVQIFFFASERVVSEDRAMERSLVSHQQLGAAAALACANSAHPHHLFTSGIVVLISKSTTAVKIRKEVDSLPEQQREPNYCGGNAGFSTFSVEAMVVLRFR